MRRGRRGTGVRGNQRGSGVVRDVDKLTTRRSEGARGQGAE